jgi:hypothetical protein
VSRSLTPSDFADSRDLGHAAPQPFSDNRLKEEHRDQISSHKPRAGSSAPLSSQAHPLSSPLHDTRSVYYTRSRGYRLRRSEIGTLADLGKFRVIGTADFARHAYEGQPDDMADDIRNLVRQGLIRKKTFEGPDSNPRELLALTQEGNRLLRANRFLPEGQATYSGFVKPKEANHDADIYRLYQKEVAKILDQGGKNPRVVLDFELKKSVNRDFAKFGTESRNQIAARNGLPVVRGRVAIPDLRIEYETPEGETARVDLELATEHYRPKQLADKARAGFSIYIPLSGRDHLHRVLEQQELTAVILTL